MLHDIMRAFVLSSLPPPNTLACLFVVIVLTFKSRGLLSDLQGRLAFLREKRVPENVWDVLLALTPNAFFFCWAHFTPLLLEVYSTRSRAI